MGNSSLGKKCSASWEEEVSRQRVETETIRITNKAVFCIIPFYFNLSLLKWLGIKASQGILS